MAQKGHVARTHHIRYCGGPRTHPPEVQSEMQQAFIVIFLLFFAVLAFGWFYWQRAKARDAAVSADASAGSVAVTDAPAESVVVTDAAPAASTDASEHVHTADDEHDHPH